MAIHPDIQARAQAEIDRVIGTARLPTLRDQDMLPYVNALISEVLRFGQIIPQGVAHLLREDDVYNGYHIPKGTIVMANSQYVKEEKQRFPERSFILV
jgi:cytochrome P450